MRTQVEEARQPCLRHYMQAWPFLKSQDFVFRKMRSRDNLFTLMS
jgi:hypothetical protein